MSWPGRALNLFRRRRLDADIEEELQFHVEARTRDNVAAGMTPDDARRDARRRFGFPLHAREASRDANVVLWLETFILDLRYAVRGLRKSPAVTAIAVLSLGLAIGANTAIFSLLNAVLLKPFPYRDAGRIAILWTTNTLNGAREQNTSVPNLEDWKAQSRTVRGPRGIPRVRRPARRPRRSDSRNGVDRLCMGDRQLLFAVGPSARARPCDRRRR